MHNFTGLRDSSKLTALQHRASSNIQNIVRESARVCFAQLEKIVASKEASSVYPCLRAHRCSLALHKYHKSPSCSTVSSFRFIHTNHPFC